MNELEQKLGLVELSYEERLHKNPKTFSLQYVPKTKQTYEMLLEVSKYNGTELRYASKKLITPELCELAVKQNGRALRFVPPKIFENASEQWIVELYNSAVKSNGLALEFVPDEYKNVAMIEQAVQFYINAYKVTPEQIELAKKRGEELQEYTKYPIAYIPKNMLNSEIIYKAVAYSPFCLRDLASSRITKKLAFFAVKTNGLSMKYIPKRLISKELVEAAIENEPLSIQYTPEEFITQEMCITCLKSDYSTFEYLPEKFITEEMCLKAAGSKVFSIFNLSPIDKEKYYGNRNIKLICFSHFPEEMRNNYKILDCIIKRYKYGALPLIKWNERIEERIKENNLNKINNDLKDKPIIPLRKETIEYLLPKVIQPEYEGISTITGKIIPTGYVREMKKQSESITLPIPEGINNSTVLTKQNTSITHELAEDQSSRKIYYVSDIHIEHHLLGDDKLRRVFRKASSDEDKMSVIKEWIEHKVLELISGADDESLLLVGGDVSNSVYLSKVFYKCLLNNWMGTVISVLGNHELWDGTTWEDWINPNYVPRTIEEIVADYKSIHSQYDDIILENALYVIFKNRKPRVLSEDDIKGASESILTEFLAKCSTIILGGIGYSGLNPEFNAEYLKGQQTDSGMGLYRTTIKTLEEDKRRSEAFRMIYEKVIRCARGKKVIVLTHTPIENWTSASPSPYCVYVNGHTHINNIRRTPEGIAVLSDNQIGYGFVGEKYINPKWKLNAFVIDKLWYDPFENDADGIYTISSEKYKEFNLGRGIMCGGCNYAGTLYMIKRSGMYMFLLKTSRSLCLMVGGRRKKLAVRDVHYYFENIEKYSNTIKTIIKPYQNALQQISKEVKMIGGSGIIHGCIVDIDFFNHIYLNPFDGKITSYFAYDISSRQTFDSIQDHLKQKTPQFLVKYQQGCKKHSISLLGVLDNNKDRKAERAIIPGWIYGTEMYNPSRIMRAVQYVWEQNVIRIWNDEVLEKRGIVGREDKLIDKNDRVK